MKQVVACPAVRPDVDSVTCCLSSGFVVADGASSSLVVAAAAISGTLVVGTGSYPLI